MRSSTRKTARSRPVIPMETRTVSLNGVEYVAEASLNN